VSEKEEPKKFDVTDKVEKILDEIKDLPVPVQISLLSATLYYRIYTAPLDGTSIHTAFMAEASGKNLGFEQSGKENVTSLMQMLDERKKTAPSSGIA
jgi:hypothetical protein